MENADNRKLMTVRKMGDLLGLKKTERYYLAKKGFFEVVQVNGQMWVVCDSFEKWYANQAKYKKVTGEEPGKELKEWSYSPREIAELLDLDESTVYELLIANNIETVIVDHWKRVPKEAFYKWYHAQKRYRTRQDKKKDASVEKQTISTSEMARILGVKREEAYNILHSKRYKDVFVIVEIAERKRITRQSFEKFLETQDEYQRQEQYGRSIRRKKKENQTLLTQTEAAKLAGVSRTTILRWIEKGYFREIAAGTVVRIPRAPFEKWLEQRKR